MAPLRLSALLAFLLSASHVMAELGSEMALEKVPVEVNTEHFGGGYWYHQTQKSSSQVCTDTNALKEAVKRGWTTAQMKAKKDKKLGAPVAAALCVPSHGIVVATSIKGVGENKQSAMTCAVVNIQHKNYGNCAEPNVVALALNEFGLDAFPAESKMAVYGKPDPHRPAGFIKPCTLDEMPFRGGCTQWLGAYQKTITVVT